MIMQKLSLTISFKYIKEIIYSRIYRLYTEFRVVHSIENNINYISELYDD